MCFHSFKDYVKMIKVSVSEPSHIHHTVWDLRENKACYSGFKFSCVNTEPAGGSGAAERETIPSHSDGNRPVSPVNP